MFSHLSRMNFEWMNYRDFFLLNGRIISQVCKHVIDISDHSSQTDYPSQEHQFFSSGKMGLLDNFPKICSIYEVQLIFVIMPKPLEVCLRQIIPLWSIIFSHIIAHSCLPIAFFQYPLLLYIHLNLSCSWESFSSEIERQPFWTFLQRSSRWGNSLSWRKNVWF